MYQEYLNQCNITSLSADELKDLLNNDEKVDTEISERVLEGLRTQKSNLFEENRKKAEQNIEKEPKIVELRARVNELAEEMQARHAKVQELQNQLREKSNNHSQETMLALLLAAAAESEEESEEVFKKIKENPASIDAHLDEFLAIRTKMHLRRIKAEKMSELIPYAQNNGPPTYTNLPTIRDFLKTPGNTTSVATVPYPIGGVSMPMPQPHP